MAITSPGQLADLLHPMTSLNDVEKQLIRDTALFLLTCH